MTPLRQRMIDDMKVRNMSALSQKAYVRSVENFTAFHGRSPDVLTFEDVRSYQLHLISRGLQPQTLNQIICALRFFYAVTLGMPEAKTALPLARRADKLPAVLSPAEFAANGHRSEKLALCRRLLDITAASTEPGDSDPGDDDASLPCPCCGGRMVIIERFDASLMSARFDSS